MSKKLYRIHFKTRMIHIDTVVGILISEFYKKQDTRQMVMSRQKMPCTRCGTYVSPTWRPGPCGTSSLCNACGLMYMVRQNRPHMIDLVVSNDRVIWMGREQDSLQWKEDREADLKDPRIQTWLCHEEERVDFVESKKRKFIDL